MDDQKTPEHSYPNADRPLPDTAEALQEAAAQKQEEQKRATIHLQEALQREKNNPTFSGIRPIKTFQGDVADAVKKDNVSMIKIALAEKRRQEKQGTFEGAVESNKINKILIIVVIVFVVLILIAGGIFFFVKSTNQQTAVQNAVTTPPVQSQILQAEQKIPFDVAEKSDNDIEKFVQNQKAVQTELGTIQQLEFIQTNGTTSADISSADFFQVLHSRASNSLIRTFEPQFIFGVYSFTPKGSFLILKIDPTLYDSAYAGMLSWEPYMQDDVGGLFINKLPPPANIATTTVSSSSNSVLFNEKPFVDRVVDNKDSRVLLDDYGRIQMLYTFFDQSTIIIASDEITLKEILTRLTTGQIVR